MLKYSRSDAACRENKALDSEAKIGEKIARKSLAEAVQELSLSRG